MPSVAGYTWPADLDVTIRREAAAAHVPLAWAYAMIAAESGFNPNAGKDDAIEASFGLLQLNTRGGQGTGYTPQALKDPSVNLRIGLPYIARALAASVGPNVELHTLVYFVATRSGHPGQVDPEDARIRRIYDAFNAFNQAYPEAFPEVPAAPSVPPAGALPTDICIRGLVAATFILSIGRPLTDLSSEDRTAVRYVASLL